MFLLGVVVLTGLYISFFYEFGYTASYDSVASIEGHAIQRVLRAIHRYASAALVLTTLVHAWRIFSSRRFTSRRRRWRWATGIASLTLVWLAGVTGYWLVWDRRAAAISEITAHLVSPIGSGSRFAVRNLLGVGSGSGSGVLLLIWCLHLGLTGLIAWFTFRHLRRSKHAWLPPRHWMAVMGGALIVVALVVPVGMLDPARPDRLVSDMPIDPFVLFLLPALLSDARWLALGLMLVALAIVLALPRLLRESDPEAVVIDAAACTGCELCVLDCPYEALTMVPGEGRLLAVVDEAMCVSCGICIGSCAFDAMTLPGIDQAGIDQAGIDQAGIGREAARPSLEGKEVVVICDRHDPEAIQSSDTAVMRLRCAGMLSPSAIREYHSRGATSVQLIGCPPSDCLYGTGNALAAERLAGERAPRPPRRMAGLITADWVSRDGLARARRDPGSTAPAAVSIDGRRLAGPAIIVLLSVIAVVFAGRAPFRTESAAAGIRVVVDHKAGATLQGIDAQPGRIGAVDVIIDGVKLDRQSIHSDGSNSAGFADWTIDSRSRSIEVRLLAGADSLTILETSLSLGERERLVITVTDVPAPPDRDQGRAIFNSRAVGCSVCHSTEQGRDGVGPSLYAVGTAAGGRVEGLNGEEYLRQSILAPDEYVVDGWPSGQMPPSFPDALDASQIEGLLVYLLSLKGEVGP